jgi:transposase
LADEWQEERRNESTRDRVYLVALQLYVPTRVRVVAERADVSKETAREYLKWFSDIGILDQIAESPDAFKRNEQYFEWRRIQRLHSLSEEQLQERLEELTHQERAYRERFGADGPGAVNALEHAEYDDVDSVWMELKEWQTIRRRIRELERARQARDDGFPALA